LGQSGPIETTAAKLRGKLYLSRKRSVTNPEGIGGKSNKIDGCQSGNHPRDKTIQVVARETGVSPRTIARDAAYAEADQLTQSGLCEPRRTPR
jgi:hypothetical protein